MQEEEQHIFRASRWVLFHGTSTYRLKEILRENRLRLPQVGDEKISLTTERSVAEYFACNATQSSATGTTIRMKKVIP
jgi:hypothetical protein